MMLQALLISLMLLVYGITDSLDDSAIDAMRKNAENRSLSLVEKMVSSWSNLDRLEYDVVGAISEYLEDNNLSLGEALGSVKRENEMLSAMSEPLVSALRMTTSTGVFVYFTGDNADGETLCNGLYYRDLDPQSTPADNSDLLFLRGSVDIARKDRISLDSFWQEVFTFSPEFPENWKTFSGPFQAAKVHPNVPAADLAYWSKPLSVSPCSGGDANKCITYTRPLFYDGRLIAMIGVEVQLSYLEKYLPPSDFAFDQGGYMLIEFPRQDSSRDSQRVDSSVLLVTGGYIGRQYHSMDRVELELIGKQGVYSVVSEGAEAVQVVLRPLRIYNTNAPFSDEQWAVAAIGTDGALFEMSSRLSNGVMSISALALIVGAVFLGVTVSRTTRPLISIANQIKTIDPAEPIIVNNSNTYEVALLVSTINGMKDERSLAEAQLKTERERYLVALESVDDTVIEYDSAEDSFVLYYFEYYGDKARLCSNTIHGFSGLVESGEVCHLDDASSLGAFIRAETSELSEVRIAAGVFTHIEDVDPVGGYYWFYVKASHIFGDDGSTVKVIGTAREKTREKLEELAQIEMSRRDPTTGLYKHDYGSRLTKEAVEGAFESGMPFALCIVSIDNFDEFETHYGRTFAAAALMELFCSFVILDHDIGTRLSNDEFMLMVNVRGAVGQAEVYVSNYVNRLLHAASSMYVGENAELSLCFSVGVVLPHGPESFAVLAQEACQAEFSAAKDGAGHLMFFDDRMPPASVGTPQLRNKPVSVSLDVSSESVVGFAFELFERTSGVHSAVNMLLAVLGRIFSMSRIVVCSYDADFDAGHVTHQWVADGERLHHRNIEKIPHEDLAAFNSMLDENGALMYDADVLSACGEGIRRLLCLLPGESARGYCFAMTENGSHSGRVLYQQHEGGDLWSGAELMRLYEVTKIVAANLSIEKSTSVSRAKSEFLSRVSHEIRTPMNAIIGMTNIARSSTQEAPRLIDALDKIDFSAKHLLTLINDVLEMSRIESGKMQIESMPFSMVGLTEAVDTLMRPSIENGGISFDIRCKVRHDGVVGDEYRLRQVIVNLLGNAGRFTPPGGVVVFEVEELEQQGGHSDFRFSVKDDGEGISPEDQPLIFKAFEQAKSSESSQKAEGTGLGLSISSNIVSAMGGRIDLNSRPGEGSEFFFTLKLEIDKDAAAQDASPDVADEVDYSGIFTGKRVLLVEDNDINVEIALYLLEESGFVVDVANNGKEAVDMFLASDPFSYDVILMDIQMPVMDGWAATRSIRRSVERPDARSVPIVATTANAFDEDMKKSIDSGMDGHIAKPIDVAKLRQMLFKTLGGDGGM